MTTSQQTGWGNYPDGTYTSGSPLAILADTPTVVPNDRAGALLNETHLPDDIDTFYAAGTLAYDAKTVAFTKGQTITGGTSGETAVIVKVVDSGTTGVLYLTQISGVFVNDELITDGAGGSATANGTIGDGVILGADGDAYIITIDFKMKPTSANTTIGEVWFDIGGAVGELYRRLVSFPKGNGIERPVVLSTAVYTLNTWEANGAKVYVSANGPAEIYDIRFIVFRAHKANSTQVDPTPSAAGFSTGYTYVYDEDGAAQQAASVTVRAISAPTATDGLVLDTDDRTGSTDANGYVEFTNLIRGATYKAKRGTGPWFRFTVPDQASFAIDSFVGLDT